MVSSGQTAVFGDLQIKSFLVDNNVEISMGVTGNSPVVLALKQGLSLCLRPEPAAKGLPRRLALDLAWQRFTDKVETMIVGMDRIHSLDHFRSDFARVQASLALGKQRAWIYRPGGTGLDRHAFLILLEALPSNSTKAQPEPADDEKKPTWVARFGKEQWTSRGAWVPIATPHVIPTLEGVPASIEDASAHSGLKTLCALNAPVLLESLDSRP